MRADAVEVALDTQVVLPGCQVPSPVQDNSRGAFAEQPELLQRGLFRFGCPTATFDFTWTPSPEWSPGNGGGGPFIGKMWCESSSASVGHDIPTKEDVSTLSATSSSSCSSFYYGDESSSTFSDTSHDLHHPGTPSDNEQDLVYLNDCSKPMHIVKQPSIYVDTQQVTVQRSVNPNTNDAIPSRSMTTQKETVQASGAPTGWTYLQVLQTIAFPPADSETPHLWYFKVTELAAQIGMPRGSTGRDIIAFVLQVAQDKNEFEKVSQLIKSLAVAARMAERQAILSSMLASLAPKEHSAAAPEGGTKSLETDSGTPCKRDYDEVSCDTESDLVDELDYSSDEDNAEEHSDHTLPLAVKRSKYTEEDLYCRIDDCLWAFDNPRTCLKHRRRHFPVQWLCPGPCKTKGGKFARDETLKRHLLYSSNVDCKEAVLRLLGLRDIPDSGTAWMAPLRDGPERPWESPGFRLTDLNTVKENKMKLRDSNKTDETPSLTSYESSRRRRYK
ncbi:hypothetical protein BGW80DRAFT_1462278 [Lactifluus volemus]|nr:hypothetical protein BGW80DRAFT_1462278 [Lactifluus volemus]